MTGRVFISYAWDSEEHRAVVRRFWAFLRSSGVDAVFDEAAAGQRRDWALWMADQVREAEVVLCVVSPEYRRRAEGHAGDDEGRGVQWEARLVRDAFYRLQSGGLRKFVPVVLPGQSVDGVPDFLAPASTTVYAVSAFTHAGAEDLLRMLHDQPRVRQVPLGPRPVFGEWQPPGADGGSAEPGRRLLDDAIAMAGSITDTRRRAEVLARIAGAVAAADPDRVEAFARLIPTAHWSEKMAALTDMVKAIAATDPGRAQRLAAQAERIMAEPHGSYDSWYLAELASAIGVADPRRARRLADEVEARAIRGTEGSADAGALAEVARAVVAAEPKRAHRLVKEVERMAADRHNGWWDARTTARIAVAVTTVDRGRGERLAADAERMAREQNGHHGDASALEEVARVLAAAFPARTARIIGGLGDGPGKAHALAGLARAVADGDPDSARALVAQAQHVVESITDEDAYLRALSATASALAAVAPDEAERLAQSLPDASHRVPVLAAVATTRLSACDR